MLKVLALLSMVAYTYAAVAIYPYEPKPAEFADQDGCYIADLKMVLPYKKPYYPKKDKTCLQYTCGTNNETQLFSCGAVGLPPNCYLEHNYTLDYPKCCGSPVCDTTTTTGTPTTEAVCITVTPEPVTVTTESYVTVAVTTEETSKTTKPIPIEEPSTEPSCGPLPRPQTPRPPILRKYPKNQC